MSGRMKLAALAAVVTVVSVHGTASANYFRASHPAPKYQSYKTVNRSKAKIPSNAFGSIGDRTGTSSGQLLNDVIYGNKWVGRDPDLHVRFEILRDSQYLPY
jgi:hypothetical protein